MYRRLALTWSKYYQFRNSHSIDVGKVLQMREKGIRISCICDRNGECWDVVIYLRKTYIMSLHRYSNDEG